MTAFEVYIGKGKLFDMVWVYCTNGCEGKSNYAIKPIAEQALRSNQTIVPQRLIAALEVR